VKVENGGENRKTGALKSQQKVKEGPKPKEGASTAELGGDEWKADGVDMFDLVKKPTGGV